MRLKKKTKRRHDHSSTNSCFQEEDNDDPLCPDQRPLGNLDGPQVHRNHVKTEKDFPNKTTSQNKFPVNENKYTIGDPKYLASYDIGFVLRNEV